MRSCYFPRRAAEEQRTSGGLELAFRIDQEICGGDNLLVDFESLQHHIFIPCAWTKDHFLRIEVAIAPDREKPTGGSPFERLQMLEP